MAKANYKLDLSPGVDTVFVLEIGGKYANVNKPQGTLNNIYIQDNNIRVRIELGGYENAQWSLDIEVEDKDTTYKTIPSPIKGAIGKGGGSAFDRQCPLKKK